MEKQAFDELLRKSETVSLKEFNEIKEGFGDDKLSRNKLEQRRRKYVSDSLQSIIVNSNVRKRTVYERSFTPRKAGSINELEQQIDSRLDQGYAFAKELVEGVFDQNLIDLNDSSEFGDDFLLLNHHFSQGMIFTEFYQYISDLACLDMLVAKDGILLMQYLHAVSLDDSTEHMYIVAPEHERFEDALAKITGGKHFIERKIDSVEKDQPRGSIFGPYLKGNEVSLEALTDRDPIKPVEAGKVFVYDLVNRYLKHIVNAQDRQEYGTMDALFNKFDEEVLKFRKVPKDQEKFEIEKARMELNYGLLKHYFRVEGWSSKTTQSFFEEITTFENNNPETVEKLDYDPVKRRMRLFRE